MPPSLTVCVSCDLQKQLILHTSVIHLFISCTTACSLQIVERALSSFQKANAAQTTVTSNWYRGFAKSGQFRHFGLHLQYLPLTAEPTVMAVSSPKKLKLEPPQEMASLPECSVAGYGKPALQLPHFYSERYLNCPLISSSTLHDIIVQRRLGSVRDATTIVDCRFRYEFDGGHVKTAVNCESWVQLAAFLSQPIHENAIMVLYCEFSLYRVALL